VHLTNRAAIHRAEGDLTASPVPRFRRQGPKGLVKNAKNADEVVMTDGCPGACGLKIVEAQGITPVQHVIVPDCGIQKASSTEYTEDGIKNVVVTVWSGKVHAGAARSRKSRPNLPATVGLVAGIAVDQRAVQT
jgi:hypothetical protein